MGSKNNLSTKIILMVEVILLVTSILFCTVSIFRARVGIRKAIQQRMLDIANCASGSVNGNQLKTLTKENVGSPVYNDIYKTLAVFRDNVELEYVYCIRDMGDGQFIFTMDLDLYTPASFGDSVKYTDALARAARGTAAVDIVPYSDAWGTFYSAYSPVFDSSGKVAGIIAVDFSAEWFDGQLSAQTYSTIFSYLIILCLSLLVAAVLSMITVRPFVRMQGALLEEKVLAESANRAKSDFLANMSHEIRTPINTMLGMNEMILREERYAKNLTDKDVQMIRNALENIDEYAVDVENAGQNLLAIVNDILDFSKIETGRMDLVEAPYHLSSMINDLNNMIYLKTQNKMLDYIIDIDPMLPDELYGDQVRVKQIFSNILNNAVKYTNRGSVKFTIRGDRKSDGILLLTAAVEDTGIGIRPEDVEKLFTRFERLEMERNNTVEGTGLGLVITQRLLEMMHGNITVDSEYGVGSTFTVTIPQKIVSETPLGDVQKRFKTNVMKTGYYRESFYAPKASILIVDDTKMNLTVVINLLKKTQIQIDTALSGKEAVSMAATKSYDLILMDQRMPGMDGTEALHCIRQQAGLSQMVPVICLTADAVVGARERYMAEGFTDYLTKPIDSYSLEKLLMKYLPQEKVESVYVGHDTDSPDNSSMNDEFSFLHAVGIETQTGLKYCQNDRVLYRTMLEEYAGSEPEKLKNLQNSYDERNWHDYAVYVHAIKSSSKMIGALTLYEQAAALESAADAGDSETIFENHYKVIEGYKAITRAIISAISVSVSATDDDVLEFLPDDTGIMEFLPDGE